MFFALISICFSVKFNIVAVDTEGLSHQFASVEYQPLANTAKANLLNEADFEPGFIQSFQILRNDGKVVQVTAQKYSNFVSFKLFLIDDLPVGIEILNTGSKNRGVLVTLNRAKKVAGPQSQPVKQAEGPTGIMGLVSKYWWVGILVFVLPKLMGGGQQQQQ